MNKYRVSGLPVTRGPRLVGILTNRDLRFEKNLDQPVSAVMTKDNLVTVSGGHHARRSRAPAATAPHRKTAGGRRGFQSEGIDHRKRHPEKIGIPERGKRRTRALARGRGHRRDRGFSGARRGIGGPKADALAIDTAHGHSARVMEAIREVKRRLPEMQLLAGNVGTEKGARELIALGIDGIKVGIGPGSICTTRVVTGAGVPQITAILEAARAAKGTGVPVIADGGIKYSGDISKAIAAGARGDDVGGFSRARRNLPAKRFYIKGARSNRIAAWARWARCRRDPARPLRAGRRGAREIRAGRHRRARAL